MNLFSFFRSGGVLGMNARNLLYIKPFNPRKAIAFADDKLKTKAFLSARGIPTAKVFAQISTREQLRSFNFASLPDKCVLKPNFGYGGEGIRVFTGRDKHGDFTEGKKSVTSRELYRHIEDILDGKFSVNGRRDTAFFEQLLKPHKSFLPFRPAGLPDIRVVVFNLVPVMAMLRIPTGDSAGKANLHLGGIGIGIDLAEGALNHAVQYNKTISRLPHGADFHGIELPYWEQMLLICSRIQQITNIGYLAVDLTIDQENGPMLLEVNARAGLSVQIANLAPLRARLDRVQGLKVQTPEKGVLLARQLFGSNAEKKTGVHHPTIGLTEQVTFSAGDANVEAFAKVDTTTDRTLLDDMFAAELLRRGAIEPLHGDPTSFRARFLLAGKKIQTVVKTMPLSSDAPMVLGNRDIAGFLIDPTKKSDALRKQRVRLTVDLFAVDRQLYTLHREIPLLKAMRPLDLTQHIEALRADPHHEPIFTYRPVELDIEETKERIRELKTDASPFGMLLKKRKQELFQRLSMLESIGANEAFTKASIALFGKPTQDLLARAHSDIRQREPFHESGAKLTAEQVKVRFEDVLMRYGLHQWDVTIQEELVSDCAVGGRHILLRKGATFSPTHVDALIAHEIETHALTTENGLHQTYMLLRAGMANYLETQEGLAIYWQNKVLPKHHEKRYWPALGVVGVSYALTHGFSATRRHLEDIGYSKEKALKKTIGLKRGMGDTSRPGAFTKDLVYYRGHLNIQDFVDAGGDLSRLYIGKVALEDLELVEQLPHIKTPLLLPLGLLEKK